MKKALITFCLLVILSSSFVFAQNEKNVNIIGTFGMGGGFISTIETFPQMSWIFDLNLISKSGFTLSTTNVINLRVPVTGPAHTILFGMGYHYIQEKWNIGGALLISPVISDLIISGKINGSYYFFNDIGITGIVMYRQTAGISWDLTMFDVFAGVSIRLF